MTDQELPKKLVDEIEKLKRLDHYVGVFQKINTSLPRKKAERFDEILKEKYAEVALVKFNIRQMIYKGQTK